MDGTKKKGRIRAADLKRDSQPSHSSTKYDFSKIVALKGKEGRDPRNTGRPAGIESCPSGSKKICLEVHENEGTVENASQITEIATCVDQLSCDEIYRNLLLEQNGFFHLDDQYKTYAMQDFDVEKSSLKPSVFHILQRDGCKFSDDLAWLWKCTCNKDRSDMISCFQGKMHITYHEFTDRWPICQHIKIGIAILNTFDSIIGIIPTITEAEVEVFDEFDGQPITSSFENVVLLKNGLYCVWHADDYGIVSTSGREPRCLVCPHSHCSHTRTIEAANITVTSASEKKSYSKQCLSTLKIPFVSSTEMQNQYQMPVSDRFMFERNNDVVYALMHWNVRIVEPA
ncbi:uncharacterized protein LOC127838876 isoform X2 [Dreissena polymorpha]|uniref:Uncharacterized protein n=1 Tax=Dreissena polymorpha TaxID=45954 RepID=A0A9D4J4T6_DREPO|nr:uncharacterized protein LOC127838876 isoform X2 [Dreissena polymorpha]XP_052222864.1 uncharacterized protein LOC127838876 isoform X2 [Dreissena polymorpha]KAH3799821.1 hypothetical protein DPMN_153437 [Dreissena polymorpha]